MWTLDGRVEHIKHKVRKNSHIYLDLYCLTETRLVCYCVGILLSYLAS